MEINIELPLPISINMAYAWIKRRHKSEEYINWEEKAEIAYNNLKETFWIEWDEWLEVYYEYYMPIYCKNGNKKVIDVFNYEKVLSDFLSTKIKGFEDHKILDGRVKKINSGKNIVKIKIKEIW